MIYIYFCIFLDLTLITLLKLIIKARVNLEGIANQTDRYAKRLKK